MDKSNLIFLDTETTGLGAEDRLCQVAYKFRGEEKNELFKPEIPISVEAMSVAHITNRMVEDKGPFKDSKMFEDLKQILEDEKNVLVAHNAGFDAEILRRDGLNVSKSIDTFKIAHYLDKEGMLSRYNLQYLRYYFDFEILDAPAHDALGDVRVLEVIFNFYFDIIKKDISDEAGVIAEMLRISEAPILIKKFNFGKYVGEKIEDVVKKDSGYLKWLLDQKLKAKSNGEDESEDWIYTLKQHLGQKPSLF